MLLVWVPGEMLLVEGHLALMEAARMGHCQVVMALRACGVKLSDPRNAAMQGHMRSAVLSADVRAVAAMLESGIDVTTLQSGVSLLHSAALTGSLELVSSGTWANTYALQFAYGFHFSIIPKHLHSLGHKHASELP